MKNYENIFIFFISQEFFFTQLISTLLETDLKSNLGNSRMCVSIRRNIICVHFPLENHSATR